MLGFRYANRLSFAFAGTPDHDRPKEGSHFMLPVGVDGADPTDVSEPVRRRELVCGFCGYGISVVRPPLHCPMCAAFDWRSEGTSEVQQTTGGDGVATAMSEEFVGTKRRANEVIREALGQFRKDEPIAFFCECANEHCYQAVWLTGPAYDQARAEPKWSALVPGHRAPADGAMAVVSSAGAALARERTGQIAEADD